MEKQIKNKEELKKILEDKEKAFEEIRKPAWDIYMEERKSAFNARSAILSNTTDPIWEKFYKAIEPSKKAFLEAKNEYNKALKREETNNK